VVSCADATPPTVQTTASVQTTSRTRMARGMRETVRDLADFRVRLCGFDLVLDLRR
jgi:hypothetical protein